MSVSNSPGAIVTTRTPKRASSGGHDLMIDDPQAVAGILLEASE
jgi:hypothetical protein